MERERFEKLVARAVLSLPEEFCERLENIDIVVEDFPTPRQRRESGLGRNMTLLGLYEGVPLTARGAYYGSVMPDKITIFQGPVEERCRNDTEIVREVEAVVRHEIAHHFGISDARLTELQKKKRRPGGPGL
ncbi:MAG: metallopeptidase family protein [Chloroflexota bacterium]